VKWITRERVKVDRVACPWLIKDDHELNAAEWMVYDALYAYCQEMIRQGRSDGAFKAGPSQQDVRSTNPWDRTGEPIKPNQ
jgi:hypothetical protein